MRRSVRTRSSVVGVSMLLASISLAGGCLEDEQPARYLLNREGQDRADTERYSPEKLGHTVDAVTALFGTADDPFVPEESGLDLAKIRRAAGPVRREADGQQAGLYRKYCAHCHGITGDGAGVSAGLLNPYPRDFRKGTFKFTSTGPGQKPTDADLTAIISAGIPGTAMPSFGTLPSDQIEALVEYVKYLALRGECELVVQSLVFDAEEELDHDLLWEEVLIPLSESWIAAQDPGAVVTPEVPPPTDREASIAAGRALFTDENVGCAKCHGATGAGDTPEHNYDIWNDAKKGLSAEEVAAQFSLPIQEIRPRDFRQGVFRGGGTPVDIYRRIYAGIKGTPMPSKTLEPEQIWNLVDFVQSLAQPEEKKND